MSCSPNSCLTGAFPFLGNVGSSVVWIYVALPCKIRAQRRLNEVSVRSFSEALPHPGQVCYHAWAAEVDESCETRPEVVGLPPKLLSQGTTKLKIEHCHQARILAFISVSFDTVSDQSHSSIGSAWLLITAANASPHTVHLVGKKCMYTTWLILASALILSSLVFLCGDSLPSFPISHTVSSESLLHWTDVMASATARLETCSYQCVYKHLIWVPWRILTMPPYPNRTIRAFEILSVSALHFSSQKTHFT